MSSKSKFKRLTMHSVLALSLLAVTAPVNTYADNVSSAVADSVFDIPSIGSVWINNSSYFELRNVRLTPGTDNNIVSFTVKAVNGGSSDIQFIDYWIRLQSPSGAKFTVNVMPQDKEKNIIPSGSTQEIQFFANVTPSLALSELQFKVIKWDFSATDYQRELGTLVAPENYSTVTPAGSKANIKIAKTSIQAFIKKANISSNEENYLPNLLLELQNTDSRSLKLPNLKFMIRTADGLMYPLQAAGINENTTIDPLMKKEIALSGKLPRTIDKENWQLVITESSDSGTNTSLNIAVAEFYIPKATDEQLSSEKEQSFSNKDGTYIAKLEALQRVPWEDDDIISASISLKSKENKSMPIPNLTGYIKLDDSVKVEVKIIQTDNVIGLQPNKEIRLQLLGRIPYTYDFSEITVHLQEKEGNSEGNSTNPTINDLLHFKVSSNFDSVPLVNAREHYKLGGIGRSANYTVHAVHNFIGKSSDVITAQVEVENLEKRANELSKLVAHFKGSDGTIYPATITDIKSKISPSGKALLFVWANIANNKADEITQLIIGEGITEGKFTQGDSKPDSYVNAVSFFLPDEKKAASNSIKDIDLFPYKLSMSRVGASAEIGKTTSNVKISFDYDLEKDARFEVLPEDYKLVLEMEDLDGMAKLSQVLDIEKSTSTSSSNTETLLKIGKNQIEFWVTDSDFIYKARSIKKYKLNIYHQFQGQKKLIASKELDWFIYSD
ncbi:hypothetical protein [Paenibacillus sp. GCM10012303]|uniref:hypothetical protein n=1 Tax=Paenibacillus sp. GCM10012303 TaxID=3317340 RepID=UPI00360962FA